MKIYSLVLELLLADGQTTTKITGTVLQHLIVNAPKQQIQPVIHLLEAGIV
jgi:hypothetical protein